MVTGSVAQLLAYSTLKCELLHFFHRVYTDPKLEKYRQGSILMCVPGLKEIGKLEEHYAIHADSISGNFEIVPFHSQLSSQELRLVRRNLVLPNLQLVKIVAATSIADSSLTLSSCKIVFDSCLIKLPFLDVSTNMNVLMKTWTGNDTRTQRRGRTGRENEGLHVTFVPRRNCDVDIESELERTQVNDVFVRILALSESDVGRVIHFIMPCFPTKYQLRNFFFVQHTRGFVTKFFKKYLISDVPDKHINAAISSLLNAGLIVRKAGFRREEKYDGYQLSGMGSNAGQVQYPPTLTRACVFASSLGCFEQCAISAAINKDPFRQLLHHTSKSLRIYYFQLRFASDTPSDAMTLVACFKGWSKATRTVRLDGKPKEFRTRHLLTPPHETPRIREDNNEDYFGCDLEVMDEVDSNVYEMAEMFKEQNLDIVSASAFKAAKDDNEKRDVCCIRYWIGLTSFDYYDFNDTGLEQNEAVRNLVIDVLSTTSYAFYVDSNQREKLRNCRRLEWTPSSNLRALSS